MTCDFIEVPDLDLPRKTENSETESFFWAINLCGTLILAPLTPPMPKPNTPTVEVPSLVLCNPVHLSIEAILALTATRLPIVTANSLSAPDPCPLLKDPRSGDRTERKISSIRLTCIPPVGPIETSTTAINKICRLSLHEVVKVLAMDIYT